ncbi:MAG TPA: serine/threonine-protein phosphatase, partial [Streptomyces sp.]
MDLNPQHELSACPGCAEPLESGDRFCGACGYALTAAPEPSEDRPTVVLGPQPEEADPVGWPAPAPRTPAGLTTPTQHPGDLPATDSGGGTATAGVAGGTATSAAGMAAAGAQSPAA